MTNDIIYRAYLDYGPYETDSELGYFKTALTAHTAILKSAKERGFTLEKILQTERGYSISICEWDYQYKIQIINVQP